jgi:hypothetical protein
MDNQLLTLSKIFTERLFRIPDYQRGYAWTEKQLKDFWNDIYQLDAKTNHYTGVLTLESVTEAQYQTWEDDVWIIENKSYQPFFVVDGQQRLTTSIILIQCIIERIEERESLNFTEKREIQKKFIFESKDAGISRSYVFGYEKDNPSYEFLKTKIFCEMSSSSREEETIYTQNLSAAKIFFIDRLASFDTTDLEVIYKKITQQLLFNIFTIAEEVDVCVAFETMNNRGKPLSSLELLKNRLIYLSLKLDAESHEKTKLRTTINDCWKSIYHNLGRNKDQPLEDDRFLLTHYLMYYGSEYLKDLDPDESRPTSLIRRLRNIDFENDLLEQRFVNKTDYTVQQGSKQITLADIYQYVSSLQHAVTIWYKMWNPFDSDFSEDVKIWLDKINRLANEDAKLLILVFFQHEKSDKKRVDFLQAIERNIFLTLLNASRYAYVTYESSAEFFRLSCEMRSGGFNADKVIKAISETNSATLKNANFISNTFMDLRSEGFYTWPGIRYFLFEYNLDLQNHSKTDRSKIFWPEFVERKKDYVSVEHVYPRQARHGYWTSRFGSFNQKQKEALRNSLGNLLPLSKPKNSSLSNKPFDMKVEGLQQAVIGYRYGSYAENEVACEADWTPQVILSRGIKLLKFMEKRWGLDFKDDNHRRKILGLDFLPPH